MRVPAPGPILKLSRESDIRHTAPLPHLQASNLPPCNFAPVPPEFPQRSPAVPGAFKNRDVRLATAAIASRIGMARRFAGSAVVTKLSHRVGKGNLACYYCICYRYGEARLTTFSR